MFIIIIKKKLLVLDVPSDDPKLHKIYNSIAAET